LISAVGRIGPCVLAPVRPFRALAFGFRLVALHDAGDRAVGDGSLELEQWIRWMNFLVVRRRVFGSAPWA